MANDAVGTNLSKGVSDRSLFDEIVMTPMETFVRAVQEVVADPTLSGQVLLAHGNRVSHISAPCIPDADNRRNLEVLWSRGVTPAAV
jgi:hypothetical protein